VVLLRALRALPGAHAPPSLSAALVARLKHAPWRLLDLHRGACLQPALGQKPAER